MKKLFEGIKPHLTEAQREPILVRNFRCSLTVVQTSDILQSPDRRSALLKKMGEGRSLRGSLNKIFGSTTSPTVCIYNDDVILSKKFLREF
jgi:hypothetical protein